MILSSVDIYHKEPALHRRQLSFSGIRPTQGGFSYQVARHLAIVDEAIISELRSTLEMQQLAVVTWEAIP